MRKQRSSYCHPRNWPAWICYCVLKLLSLFPLRFQYVLGCGLGRLLKISIPSRRTVVRRNLEYCFPELSQTEREAIFHRHYDDVGISLFETAFAWNASDPRFKRCITYKIKGLEHFKAAQQTGKGILLLSGHFLPMEIAGRIFHDLSDFKVVARVHQNSAFEQIISQGRLRYVNGIIDRNNIKAMIRHLKEGGVLWYAPDQDFGYKRSVFANFLGAKAATLKATSRLAALTDAIVVPCCFARQPNTIGQLYGEIFPPLTPFPSGDEVNDAQRYNEVLGSFVQQFPSQYLWLHKRFKTRPKGEPSLY